MASSINGNVPAFEDEILSGVLQQQFATAASEITALQNGQTGLQGSLTTLTGNVSALQTKTTVSGDATLAPNGQMGVIAIRGRTWSPNAPLDGQIPQWSTTLGQWVPADPPTGSGPGIGGTINNGTVGQLAVYTGTNSLSGVNISGDATMASNGALTISTIGGVAPFTRALADTLYAPIGAGGGLPTTGGALTGLLQINTSSITSANLFPAPAGTAMVAQLASDGHTTVTIDAAGATQANILNFRKSGGTYNSPAPVPNASNMGIVQWQGWRGATGWGTAGSVQIQATALWSDTSTPTRMDFRSTRVNQVIPSLAMWIGPQGSVIIGQSGVDVGNGNLYAQTATIGTDLAVDGSLSLAGEQVQVGTVASLPAGARVLYLP